MSNPIHKMTDDEFELFLDEPKKCSRCPFVGVVGDFPMTTARGRLMIRSWCFKCLAKYFKVRTRKLWLEKRGTAKV